MALYRQIAGTGTPGDQVGLSFMRDYIDKVETEIATVNVSDTGGTSPFADPRDWNPLPQYKPPLTTTTTPVTTPSQPVQDTNNQGGTPTPLPADTQTAITNNILPLLALAGVVLVAIKGDDLLHEKRKIALLGGLGLLYYGMHKNKLV